MNISKNVKLILAKAGAVAATSAVTTDVIDMQGFEGVAFFGSIATVDPTNYIKVQQGQAANMSDAADLAGTKLAPGDNGDSFLTDIYRPRERYVQVVVTRTVSTALGDIYALLYSAIKAPVTHGATIDAETHVSPIEGTA